MKDFEILTLEKEFTHEGIKYTQIYGNRFAYLHEGIASNGKLNFLVHKRLKTAKMHDFEKWSFTDDKEAVNKFNTLTKIKLFVNL